MGLGRLLAALVTYFLVEFLAMGLSRLLAALVAGFLHSHFALLLSHNITWMSNP